MTFNVFSTTALLLLLLHLLSFYSPATPFTFQIPASIHHTSTKPTFLTRLSRHSTLLSSTISTSPPPPSLHPSLTSIGKSPNYSWSETHSRITFKTLIPSNYNVKHVKVFPIFPGVFKRGELLKVINGEINNKRPATIPPTLLSQAFKPSLQNILNTTSTSSKNKKFIKFLNSNGGIIITMNDTLVYNGAFKGELQFPDGVNYFFEEMDEIKALKPDFSNGNSTLFIDTPDGDKLYAYTPPIHSNFKSEILSAKGGGKLRVFVLEVEKVDLVKRFEESNGNGQLLFEGDGDWFGGFVNEVVEGIFKKEAVADVEDDEGKGGGKRRLEDDDLDVDKYMRDNLKMGREDIDMSKVDRSLYSFKNMTEKVLGRMKEGVVDEDTGKFEEMGLGWEEEEMNEFED